MIKLDFGGGEEIEFYQQNCVGGVRLTRPRALNALNKRMSVALTRALQKWEHDETIKLVLVEGEGRAFCAGGDVVGVYHSGKNGQPDYDFFNAEYQLNGLIGRFPKPYISYLDGIVMGGGVGISLHGSHRIVTANTVFAMPETAIGFFPDVGTAAILPHLDGHFGLYLALTGARIKWGDCLQTGLATHAIRVEDGEILRQKLCEGIHPDVVLKSLHQPVSHETTTHQRAIISDCFDAPTVEGIVDKLTAHKADSFASNILDMLQQQAPTSLKVALHHMQLSQTKSLEACLTLDTCIAHHMIEAHDFYEGVRARLIDKDNRPLWQPDRLEQVTSDKVAAAHENRQG